ncbi:MAG TPA: alpha-amylase family glycosyl hydrolase [Gaiellaceae bacterium]|nr:alpha-amylase family glycosyl hydrolase [Gaiellaceae bacterium]
MHSSLESQRIYFVMPDRYFNADPSNDTGGISGGRARNGLDPTDTGYFHGGDLKGLAGHLQRIKDLGFTALWVTPVLKQQAVSQGSAAYHGYWGLDFTTVDPHLGTDPDFADLVSRAHALGLKVYLDVVVNHTADVVQLTGTSYTDVPYRDCHGKRFNPARYVKAKTFPCLKAANMPRVPFVVAGDRNAKKPAWLNDPLNYHDRGDIDFGSCSETCFEQGDFYGLDDLFTEKPNVMKGLADIYSSWITRFKVDGFRVDTAKHVNAAFFGLWVPRIQKAAASIGVKDFPIFGEVTLNDSVDLAGFVRTRGLPQVLDFPFQQVATAYASGASGARGVANRLRDDDYFRTPNGVDPAFPTFLGNHDMGRGAEQIRQQAPGLAPAALLQHVLLGYDLLYLLRGAPTLLYGDEVGMSGSGGDKAARQDMFPTQVSDWQTETRVGSAPIGKGSSFDVQSPIETHLTQLAALRDKYPVLSTGASYVRYAKDAVLVVQRVDPVSGDSVLVAFNNGAAKAHVAGIVTSTNAAWSAAFGGGTFAGGTLDLPPVSAGLFTPSAPYPSGKASVGLKAGPDDLTAYWALTATVTSPGASVAFAIRRKSGAWQRVAVDDSPPYRAFVDPARFGKHEQVEAVAVARGVGGAVSLSHVATFRPRG